MSGLYLFARIAGTGIAIPTDNVEAVIRLGELSPVPGSPPHIAGLSALRSRVLTIIDAAQLICAVDTAECPSSSDERHAVVCEVSGHSYGILVDGVQDIRTIEGSPMPVCGRIEEAWRPFAKAVIEYDGEPRFVLSTADLLDSCLSVPTV